MNLKKTAEPFAASAVFEWYESQSAFRFIMFRLAQIRAAAQRTICTTVEDGVASPIRNRETGTRPAMRKETGTRTQNAPTIPCVITKRVMPRPLKNPMKQKRKQVKRQSTAYARR